MKILLAFLVTLLSFTESFATAQTPDKIIYKGKEYALLTNPLEQYFKLYPEKRLKVKGRPTSLWRGYMATFEFTDNGLIVKDIEVMTVNAVTNKIEMKSVLKQVFPDAADRKTGWYTGMLTLPLGKEVEYVHMGYATTYENYLLIEVKEGRFVKSGNLNRVAYIAFKQAQFERFKKTEAYLKEERALTKNGLKREDAEHFLKRSMTEYTEIIL